METNDILALYDKFERQQCVAPMYRREVVGSVVRHVSKVSGRLSNVMYSELTAVTADAAIQTQMDDLKGMDCSGLTWNLYAHDTPADLAQRLLRAGFEEEEVDPVLILDIENVEDGGLENGRFDIRRLSQPAQIQDIVAVEEAVWGGQFDWLYTQLSGYLQEHPDFISLYVAYIAGQPASVAWTYFPEGSPFASMWGGATVSAHRGAGLYKALVAIRAQEARRRGCRFLMVKVSEMSRPILERHGFSLLTVIHPYTLSKD